MYMHNELNQFESIGSQGVFRASTVEISIYLYIPVIRIYIYYTYPVPPIIIMS